ncbi:hypothetical protein OF83DRAFT_1170953 [Amylostereum chailletii]|nr:hypothetical protein OF83DRAFT_1170953 [Amylostereum chailletii]
MLSNDYSQLFSSGMRALASARRRSSVAVSPCASYISFEAESPLETEQGWKAFFTPKVLRRSSTKGKSPLSPTPVDREVKKSRRTTLPGGFVPRDLFNTSIWEKRDPSPSAVPEDEEETPSPYTEKMTFVPSSTVDDRPGKPRPLIITLTDSSLSSPIDLNFLSFSATSLGFPSPRFRQRAMSLSVCSPLSGHPYSAVSAAQEEEEEEEERERDADDWRRFHENVEWAAYE